MTQLSAEARNLNWLVSNFVERVPGVSEATVVSSDGLLIALSTGLDRSSGDRLAAVSAGLLVVSRRALPLAVLAFLLPFFVLTTRAEIDRALASTGPSGRPFAGAPGTVLNWVDRTLPPGARVAIVPYPVSLEFALSVTSMDTTLS